MILLPCQPMPLLTCLPPGVDELAPPLAHDVVEPVPGLVVDGFADGAEDAQRGQVVLLRPRVAMAQKQAQCRRGAVEVGDAQALDCVPVSAWKGYEGTLSSKEARQLWDSHVIIFRQSKLCFILVMARHVFTLRKNNVYIILVKFPHHVKTNYTPYSYSQ